MRVDTHQCDEVDGKKSCLSVLVFVPVRASQVAAARKYARVAAFALDTVLCLAAFALETAANR